MKLGKRKAEAVDVEGDADREELETRILLNGYHNTLTLAIVS